MLEVSHLHKQFGDLTAINDISFKLVPGEILGFLGPNGAGKSTTMKVITGFLAPSSGTVTVWGCDVATDPLGAQKHLGYLPEGAPLYEEMTPRTFLAFIAEVRGITGAESADRIRSVVSTMSLEAVLDQRIETLSKGFKRRVGLAQAILHDPDVLILDEPTDGLDPVQKHHVREMIQGLSKDKIVIISTHILEEVTAVCSRAIIIAGGSVLADCTPDELESRSRYHLATTIRFSGEEQLNTHRDALSTLEDVSGTDVSASSVELTLFPGETEGSSQRVAQQAVEYLRGHDADVTGIFQERGRLDEVFREITGLEVRH
ncbi:MAG: ABC transporter ATP-binding protein [Gammaproteobacteria bacterium]|uniref:ABC transporter ATP-binding protein n=1 Tax=OM182 bacterium MED-G24 TaxID=1986255 RepID=A0A2A5WY70_9GAMM|nr:ABC transporter ATP-binding protein [Gammaproteobacteria bacterium]PDH41495.1 MAG: ABC transporter ATP-binding protein [OM182 bacterium MED-G24]RPG25902.1 MAG: ATP-binding cassette domain-containing protein [Gammaproteobacteria bacterium TMED50]|tara:strand:+ start:264 stop:1214 length:951 start_codon:yes stop_codon:yes gene_type:complete